jgi:simple sugar transport system ATP-binding protein
MLFYVSIAFNLRISTTPTTMFAGPVSEGRKVEMASGGEGDRRSSPVRLELRGIRKAYPGVVANDGIGLSVKPGEIHAVLGENGAGKSTLMKVIYGLAQPDAGEILWDGRPVRVRGPGEAQRLGICMVLQHFSLFDTLTAAQNVSLAMAGSGPIADLSKKIAEVSRLYGLPVNPAQHIHAMSVGERQRVEIVRCLLQSPRLLIMDEPTSVLNPQAVQQLFKTLRQLAGEGCSILYISHKLDEIRELCDSATVLRAGKVTGVCDPRRETAASMARMMTGSDLPPFRRSAPAASSEPRLALSNLSVPSRDPFGVSLKNIDLTVNAGEIVGIAGVSGNGQRELVEVISGERRLADAAAVTLCGAGVANLGPRERRSRGLGFVPEERLGRGVVPSLTLTENVLLTASPSMVRHGLVRFAGVNGFARRCIAEYRVKCGGPAAAAGSLSGGNLQKYIVGREILQEPRVLVAAQPTWGVDVGSALFIRQTLLNLRDAGTAVLVISEELDELFEVADRIAVMTGGRLVEPRPTAETSVSEIGLAMADHAAAARPPSGTPQAMESGSCG